MSSKKGCQEKSAASTGQNVGARIEPIKLETRVDRRGRVRPKHAKQQKKHRRDVPDCSHDDSIGNAPPSDRTSVTVATGLWF
jgi:hypothetical protein